MRAEQRKLRSGMIECRCFVPGAYVVAKLAALLGIARSIALVRILMAVDAGHGLEVIASRRGWVAIHGRFMTVYTRGRSMSSGELKSGFLVPCQRKCRGLETIQGVT